VHGVGIHFIHQRGNGPAPFPLILTHGYPDSFYRFLKLIPLLTDPVSHGGRAEDAFDVVVPDLPGYGFSDKPAKHGTIFQVNDLWVLTDVPFGYLMQKKPDDPSPAEKNSLNATTNGCRPRAHTQRSKPASRKVWRTP
jgi:pimeloyl-ACP methyl ester carboxylesterase